MLKAAVQSKAEGICQPVLLGNDEVITKLAAKLDLSLEGIEIVNLRHPSEQERRERYARILAEKRQREGYTYQQERGFDVAQDVAKNEAVGQFTNMGVGLGTMAGVGGAVGGMVGGAVNNAMNAASQTAQLAQQEAEPADDMAAFKAKVDKLTVMKEAGIISEEEFAGMKAKLLSDIMG
jgi:phosphotransacetylase